MRKIKSTALLGAFVAVASVGVISHEAHGANLSYVTTNIPKEVLPGSVTLQAPVVTPGVTYPSSSNVQIVLTLNGATFTTKGSYTILGIGVSNCTITSGTGYSSITFANSSQSPSACSLTAGNSYTISGGGATTSFIVNAPQTSSSIVLSYSSNASNDSAPPATLAQVQPQLSVSPNSVTNAVISPSSLSTFIYGTSSATNAVVISNSAYNNNAWSNTIGTSGASYSSYTMSFLFTNIPSSVSAVSATDNVFSNFSLTTPVNGSATINFSLSSQQVNFGSLSSDKITFSFTNSSNSSISIGTIVLSSVTGIGLNSNGSTVTYPYPITSTSFINFAYNGVQIYVPDALARIGGNLINAGYITISMPSSTNISSISVLNIPGASCPTPSTSNGLLYQSATGLYVIDLSALAQQCTGLTSGEWQAGVPLVINLSGSNVSPNNITADAYGVISGYGLKRIPVVIISNGNGANAFSY